MATEAVTIPHTPEAVTIHPTPTSDPMVGMIERIALDPNCDLDKLERMLAMKERHEDRNARIAFSHALSVARAEMPPIVKDATVDFRTQKGRTHYKHETLAGIAKAIDPILSKNGFSYRFRTGQENSQIMVTCILSHKDGHEEENPLVGNPDTSGSKNSFQAVGSAVTYLQRYSLKAALGLSAEVDDDAQAVSQVAPPFNAEAAAGRITAQISRAETIEELAGLWAQENQTIIKIREENTRSLAALSQAKELKKIELLEGQNGQKPELGFGHSTLDYADISDTY